MNAQEFFFNPLKSFVQRISTAYQKEQTPVFTMFRTYESDAVHSLRKLLIDFDTYCNNLFWDCMPGDLPRRVTKLIPY
jgi:hypothetical protein